MSLTLTLLKVMGRTDQSIQALVLIAASGNYPSGGDIVNFATLAGQQASVGGEIDADVANQLPDAVVVDSETGGWGASGGGYYECQSYTNANPPTPLTPQTCKLRAFSAGGTEESAGAYDSTIKDDRIVMLAVWNRER